MLYNIPVYLFRFTYLHIFRTYKCSILFSSEKRQKIYFKLYAFCVRIGCYSLAACPMFRNRNVKAPFTTAYTRPGLQNSITNEYY